MAAIFQDCKSGSIPGKVKMKVPHLKLFIESSITTHQQHNDNIDITIKRR